MDIIIFTLYNNDFNNGDKSLFSDSTCDKIEIQSDWNLYNHFGKEKIIDNNKCIWKLKNAENIYAYPCLSKNNLNKTNLITNFLTNLIKDIGKLDFNNKFTKTHNIYFVIHDKDIGISEDDYCLDIKEEDKYFFEHNPKLKDVLKDTEFFTCVFQHESGTLYDIISDFDWSENENKINKFILNQIEKCL